MYICKTCNYESKDFSRFKIHINSKKHKNNLKERNNEQTNINFICEYCNKIFGNKNSIYKHRKKCIIYIKINNNLNINPNHDIDNIHNNSDNYTNTNTNTNDNISNNQIIDKIEIKGEELKSEIIQVKTSVNKAIRKTTSLIKYLMTNYNHVQPLIQLTQDHCKKLIDSAYGINNKIISPKDIDILTSRLILDYEKNKLYIYIGNMIYDIVSDKDINNQPIWTSDTSRLNYAVKLTIDKWYSDHAGEKFSDFVIKPISDYIYKIIEMYQYNFYDDDKFNTNYEDWNKLNKSNELKDYINSQIFKRDILKYLSPKLRFLEEELHYVNNLCNVEKYKKIIYEERDKKLLEENNKKILEDINDFIKPVKINKKTKKTKKIENSDCDSDSDDDCEHNNYMVIKKRII
jgi:hypothetical protein